MKSLIKFIISLLIITALIISISYIFNKKKYYDVQINQIEAKISDLTASNDSLVVSVKVKDKVIDSLTILIQDGKNEISEEREKRELLKKEMQEEIDNMVESTDDDNISFFISETYDDYPVMRHSEYYLVSMKSIRFANNALINVSYLEDENLSLINEIQSLNNVIGIQDEKIKELGFKIQYLNEIISNKEKIIVNLNSITYVYEKKNRKLRLTKNISIGIGAIGIGIAIFKN